MPIHLSKSMETLVIRQELQRCCCKAMMVQYTYCLHCLKHGKKGSVKGLVARGGFVVDMEWDGVQLKKAKIHSRLGGVLRIRSYVPLKGKGVKVADGACPNPLYASAVIKEPVVSKLINPQVPVLYRTYEYDIVTQPGEDYSLERSM